MKTVTELPAGFTVGAVVRTPLRREARVIGILPDNRLDLVYIDDHDHVALMPSLVRLVRQRKDEQ